MLQIRKPIEITSVCPEGHVHLYSKKNNNSGLKEDSLLFGPGLNGRPVKLYQIARYDE